MESPASKRNPWLWVPSLYFVEGVPYVVAMTVSVIMYKRLGISNTDIALYTSWLYLPWVLKPLWSPLVDMVRTKRFWVITLQLFIGASLASVAFILPGPRAFQYSLAIFWLMAFASATHDIAADGFYMLGLAEHQQAAYAGMRSTFYRIAMIAGQGLLVMLAGMIEQKTNRIIHAWSICFTILGAAVIVLGFYHLLALPFPADDRPTRAKHSTSFAGDFMTVFARFFSKPGIVSILAFLLFYRFAEAQLIKLIQPFLLDPVGKGGLGLTTTQVGFIYGTIGVFALTLGGILGGIAISRHGLKAWLWPMVLIIHLPDLVFVFLSHVQPQSRLVIYPAIACEQFGYGFGFTAYMLFMIMVAQGEHKTAHYAICTGFMALGMMIPGMFSGYLQDHLGYKMFFLWILGSTVPGFLVAAMVHIDPQFGKKGAREKWICQCGYNLRGNVSGTCPECGTAAFRCLACGYDLMGNVSGVCPECGEPVLSGLGSPAPAEQGSPA